MSLQICRGLLYAHREKGIIHRDLKPENILIHNGKFKLGDFGSAKRVDVNIAGRTMMTLNQGTLAYNSPESLFDRNYSFPMDIWALGCVIDEACRLVRTFVWEDNEPIAKTIDHIRNDLHGRID